jgi:hypothetical protein
MFCLFSLMLTVLVLLVRTQKAKTTRQKFLWGLFIIVALGIVFGPDIVVHVKYASVCSKREESILEKRPVQGFYAPSFRPRDIQRYLAEGYDYIEVNGTEGSYARHLRGGEVLKVDTLLSEVYYEPYVVRESLRVRVKGARIVERVTQRTLALWITAATTGGPLHEIMQTWLWERPIYETCLITSSVSDFIFEAIPPRNSELSK